MKDRYINTHKYSDRTVKIFYSFVQINFFMALYIMYRYNYFLTCAWLDSMTLGVK